MKFLVLGCNGMAGHMISLYLSEQGHDVTGFARKKNKYIDTIIGDAHDVILVKRIIKEGNYDSVINCIGLLNANAENNKADAIYLNAYLPQLLAEITERTKTQIIHMSTDCVFSGKTGGYTEYSFKDGDGYYDRTKALGEIDDVKNITLRNSIIGPDINENGVGLLNWFMRQTKAVHGFTRAIWTGQTTLQLAKTMEYAAAVRAHGIYNMVPDLAISKHDLLELFNKYIRKDMIDIIPDDSFVMDKSLVRKNFEGFDYQIPDYDVQIRELGEWMRNHKDLYPHYEL